MVGLDIIYTLIRGGVQEDIILALIYLKEFYTDEEITAFFRKHDSRRAKSYSITYKHSIRNLSGGKFYRLRTLDFLCTVLAVYLLDHTSNRRDIIII